MELMHLIPTNDYTFDALGATKGGEYVVGDNALVVLNEINCKLACEDTTLRTFRRAIGLRQNMKTDLIPFLINVKAHNLVDAIIRILVNLSIPVECLFSIEVMMRTDAGRNTVSDLNALLTTSKESFAGVKAIKAIVDHIKHILKKDSKLSFEHCDSINNCLLLLRNILHIPENPHQKIQINHKLQNQIIWNLFTFSFDKLLIYLMSCSQKSFWCVTIVQLIALMYKDQQVNTLQKLLNAWLEESLSDSSEDFESNTSPAKDGSGDSSPMLTSDRTSDSSDSGGSNKVEQMIEDRHPLPNNNNNIESIQNRNVRKSSEYSGSGSRSKSNNIKTVSNQVTELPPSTQSKSPTSFNASKSGEMRKRKYPSISEQSDCGYGTLVEHQESISTSSNEDNYPCQKVHQKPPCNQKQRYNAANHIRSTINAQEKKECRRKKLMNRNKSRLTNMKGLLHYTPSDEDISNILKEFTVDFLLKGYGYLVQELHFKLLSESDLQSEIDTSHYFWLVTYFLKFAAQLELDLDHIKCVLSFNIVSYLTYEGVNLCEQLELMSRRNSMDVKPSLRRLHLVVTAIREFLQALNTYKKIKHLSQVDVEYIRLLQVQICAAEDMRNLFILLIRNFNPAVQSKQYLLDLIVTNHILLVIPDEMPQITAQKENLKLMEHIKQFATAEMMQQYGLLLENFYENDEFVNDCIFTMMHHIGGDLDSVTILFQPIIIKTFSQIWENEHQLCDDWSDLIEYVINKFINTPQKAPQTNPQPSLDVEMYALRDSEERLCDDVWSKEEIDVLYWYYEQSKTFIDAVGKIVKLFSEGNFNEKTRIAVIQQLLQQDIVTRTEYNELMKFENAEYERNFKSPSPPRTPSTVESGIDVSEPVKSQSEKSNDDIQLLKEKLLKENKGKQILWLQKILVECCFAKLRCNDNRIALKTLTNSVNNFTVLEPVPYHCILKNQSVPVVPWNSKQSNILLYQPFILLLHKLGFHLPADTGKLYVRIPEFWTADILFNVAEKLGPIDESILKFDIKELNGICAIDGEQIENPNKNSCFETISVPRMRKLSITPCITPTSNCNNYSNAPQSEDINSVLFGRHLYFSSTSITHATTKIATLPYNARSLNDLPMDVDEPYSSINKCVRSNVNELIDKMKIRDKSENCNDINNNDMDDQNSNSETASVASDLTRMYVSDEEDRNDIDQL